MLRVENLTAASPALESARVSFELQAGGQAALVGERDQTSALLRAITLLQRPPMGRVIFENTDLTRASDSQLRAVRRKLQYVGADPNRALPLAASVEQVLLEPLRIHRLGSPASQRAQVERVLDLFGLNRWLLSRPVTALSSALRQTVALARAFTLQPRLLVVSELIEPLEPAAALAQLNRLARVCRTEGAAWLWSTSDEQLARQFAGRVYRLHAGGLSPV